MQIRQRGGSTEFLRGTWDKDKKRTVQRLIQPSDFTEIEKAQYDAWRGKRDAEQHKAAARYSAHLLTSNVKLAIEGLAAGVTPAQPEELLEALDLLRARLRKAGIKRTVVPKTPAS